MTPADIQTARRADVLAQLDQCGTEGEIETAFEHAVIDHGGTWIPALGAIDTTGAPRSRRNSHEHEIEMLGTSGRGETFPAAINQWRKAALRMGEAA